MEGVADTYFRQVLVRAGKPDLMFTEFTSVDGLISRGYEYVARRLAYNPYEQPLIAQIWGTEPDNFYQAAKIMKEKRFAGIDINMGCPAKEVIRKGGGAALIDKPELAREIIEATKNGAGGLPVSVKTRIGRKIICTETWVTWLLKSKIDALIVHGRTEAEKSKVPAHWEEIAKAVIIRNELKAKAVIIGNGDIESRAKAEEMVKEFGADGVMIGRGALKNPWIFNSTLISKPGKAERLDLLRNHLELIMTGQGKQKPLVTMRKYYKNYVSGFRGAVKMREELMKAETREEIEAIIN